MGGLLRQFMANELQADQIKGIRGQACVLRCRMQPTIDGPIRVAHAGHGQHVR